MMITQFRNRTEFREFLGISSNSGITTSNMIVSSLTHLVTTQFQSGIPELSETGIVRNSTELHEIPSNSCSTQFPEFRSGIGCNSQGVRVRVT
jgi:hypothetical protein